MCGLYGFVNYSNNGIKDLSVLTKSLAEQSAVRGTDATGVAYCDGNMISILKEGKSAYRISLKHSDTIKALTGHTRHSTQGSEKKNCNNHPFPGKCRNVRFALAHNGVLSNDDELRKKYSLPKTKVETDSYVAVQLLESQRQFNFESIKYMAEKTEGSFSYSIIDNRNNVWLVKGDSPLSILHFPKLKMYVYASTEEILYKALVDFPPLLKALKKGEFNEVEISEGDILKIHPDGRLERKPFEYSKYYGRGWWDYGSFSSITFGKSKKGQKRNEYIEDLKSVATFYGYSADTIDDLINEGFTLEEIEECLYYGYCDEI